MSGDGRGIGRRVAALERVLPARSAAQRAGTDTVSVEELERHLTPEERESLASLWGRVGTDRLPNGHLDLAAVSNDDLDALETWFRRVLAIKEGLKAGVDPTPATHGVPV